MGDMQLITKPEQIQNILNPVVKRTKRGEELYNDTIYTFDIEVTSLFKINGAWRVFDYNIPASSYRDIEKASCVYACMLGVEDNIYLFRDFSLFEDILKYLKQKDGYRNIIYIHNMAYEFQFMRMFLNKYYREYASKCST